MSSRLTNSWTKKLQKKEMQRQLLLSRRKRLRNIIRLVSQESFVTPTEEVEEARYVHDYINGRSKKKPGRKRKEREERRERLPGDIDPDLPYYRREMWEKRLKVGGRFAKKGRKGTTVKRMPIKRMSFSWMNLSSGKKVNRLQKASKRSVWSSQKKSHISEDAKEIKEIKESIVAEETKPVPPNQEQNVSEKVIPSTDEPKSTAESNNEPVTDIKGEDVVETLNGNRPEENNTHVPEETTNKSPTPSSKQVKFADNEGSVMDKEGTLEEGAEVFEGPVQRIARNMIYFLELDEKIDNVKLKAYLFGEQSLLPASRRYRDLETIVRIGQAVNPYAVVKDERDELLEPATELTEEDSRFDELKKLPKLGVTEMIYEDDEDEMEEETAEIVLNTEAPSGLYLPNGNKKACLISGAEVRYFDPALGVPYSTVEVYKLLKQMETGTIPWYSIERGYNDFGSAEIYLGSRDGEVRHAKGVPEGFDG
ncbi:hypothetical protein PGUG_00886 [Meyerozyma guilliermondii ATCC 6260]|uniref:Vps72/YL1 C-terminal domain-containing protein n=1 Tax=Meyerozyma guilliermondii (strain ATCC 6260 / CBS 566 / DSM 6381 / JCM 1539 / NBRC 10279 / NRRL Y-324) TaxID=294746 RepID=A5DC81_PICGU|nr:uncharacterized protein PGUG_00886 [Meyerozyma guilliermondii ATCC 6260]EDK36788.2 hypothetical protein PGUG_00886 [Meyerozyma guilliermondii ATCC 6260]